MITLGPAVTAAAGPADDHPRGGTVMTVAGEGDRHDTHAARREPSTSKENVMTTESAAPRTPDPVSPSALRWPSQRGGPYPRLRTDFATKTSQGFAVMELVLGEGRTFRQAAAVLGMSLTTAWRRYWFVLDLTTPERHGCKPGPMPPQRGTRACPRGRPWLPTYDGVRSVQEGNPR